MLEYYNETKGGVNTINQLREAYTVARKTNRWPIKIFYFLLDVAAINSWVIFNKNKPRPADAVERRTYLRELVLLLIRPHTIVRLQIQQTPHATKKKLKQFSTLKMKK